MTKLFVAKLFHQVIGSVSSLTSSLDIAQQTFDI